MIGKITIKNEEMKEFDYSVPQEVVKWRGTYDDLLREIEEVTKLITDKQQNSKSTIKNSQLLYIIEKNKKIKI